MVKLVKILQQADASACSSPIVGEDSLCCPLIAFVLQWRSAAKGVSRGGSAPESRAAHPG